MCDVRLWAESYGLLLYMKYHFWHKLCMEEFTSHIAMHLASYVLPVSLGCEICKEWHFVLCDLFITI